MSAAWETTPEDVATVLERHGINLDEDRIEQITDDELDHDAIENGVLCYTDFDDQVASAFDDIENQLKEKGIIPADAEKLYPAP